MVGAVAYHRVCTVAPRLVSCSASRLGALISTVPPDPFTARSEKNIPGLFSTPPKLPAL